MTTGKRPAFYALPGTKGWQDYLNLLHVPYTLWHLAYVVLGATISPTVHMDRLLGTLLAFFLPDIWRQCSISAKFAIWRTGYDRMTPIQKKDRRGKIHEIRRCYRGWRSSRISVGQQTG